jgi:hypothetical protein
MEVPEMSKYKMIVGLNPVLGIHDTDSRASLFNSAANSSDYITPNGRMVSEYKRGKYLEGGI